MTKYYEKKKHKMDKKFGSFKDFPYFCQQKAKT